MVMLGRAGSFSGLSGLGTGTRDCAGPARGLQPPGARDSIPQAVGLTSYSRLRRRPPPSCPPMPASPTRMRPLSSCLALGLALALAAPGAPAQQRLPDIGSSADTVLAPAQQEEYGQMLLAQLRHYDYVLDDPLVDAWLDGVGNRLAAASDDPAQPFTFFMMKDRSVNAFATLGGYIGMNAGLVLAAGDESEVAGVLAHEIAHVTQSHV